jgi:hypothetical protein
MSIKNPNDTIWNQTRRVPACSELPQPTARPRVQTMYLGCPKSIIHLFFLSGNSFFPKFAPEETKHLRLLIFFGLGSLERSFGTCVVRSQ